MKRFSGRRKVLFSDKYGWEKDIRRRINAWRYAPFFKSFSEADLDAFDVLIPQHLTDIVFLNENHAELHGKKCFIPSLSAMNLCNNKMQFNDFMVDMGFGRLIPKVNDELAYPYILKKCIDENGSRSRIINSKLEEKPFQRFISSDEYYRQECIPGSDEFTTHILMAGGQVVFHRTLRFIFKKPLFVKGVGCKPSKHEKLRTCPYIDIFTDILNHLEFEGLCCFNYKVIDENLKIFEVNPRYGGSLTRFLSPMLKVYSNMLESQ